jgi:hypothetical protein
MSHTNSIKNLPWIHSFLYSIQDEYKKRPPQSHCIGVSDSLKTYIYSIADKDDQFDTLGLKKECGKALREGNAKLLHSVSYLGSITVVSLNASPIEPTWNLWWRCVRLLNQTNRPVRIILFAHPKQRSVPYTGKPIQEEHLNGGSAFRCDPGSIVVYRKEECTRVFIHELLHASCSDPYHMTTAEIEADTEAWAEMILCGMAAKGQRDAWIRYMREQLAWSARQAFTVKTYHRVQSSKEYAWRYLVGRLDVWKNLGIVVPNSPNERTPVHSLRFTICEPSNT